jgi:hypothetical protein
VAREGDELWTKPGDNERNNGITDTETGGGGGEDRAAVNKERRREEAEE